MQAGTVWIFTFFCLACSAVYKKELGNGKITKKGEEVSETIKKQLRYVFQKVKVHIGVICFKIILNSTFEELRSWKSCQIILKKN